MGKTPGVAHDDESSSNRSSSSFFLASPIKWIRDVIMWYVVVCETAGIFILAHLFMARRMIMNDGDTVLTAPLTCHQQKDRKMFFSNVIWKFRNLFLYIRSVRPAGLHRAVFFSFSISLKVVWEGSRTKARRDNFASYLFGSQTTLTHLLTFPIIMRAGFVYIQQPDPLQLFSPKYST